MRIRWWRSSIIHHQLVTNRMITGGAVEIPNEPGKEGQDARAHSTAPWCIAVSLTEGLGMTACQQVEVFLR